MNEKKILKEEELSAVNGGAYRTTYDGYTVGNFYKSKKFATNLAVAKINGICIFNLARRPYVEFYYDEYKVDSNNQGTFVEGSITARETWFETEYTKQQISVNI